MQDQHKTRQALVRELQALRERVKGLEASAARRDDAQDQLRESEAKFSTIFRSSPEVITITSITEGRILEVNDSFTRTTGYGREEAIGRTTLELGIWGDGEDRARMTEALQRRGSIRDLDFIFRSRDGRRIHGLVSAGTVDIAGTPCLLAVIRDITDRKREERALAIMNRIQDVFLKITDDSLYARVLDILLEAVESPFGYFAFLDEHGDFVSPSMTKDVWDKCRMNRKSIVFPRESWGGLWGASLTQGRTLIANGGLRAPEGHVPLSRAICVPVLFQGSVIGQFGLANKKTDYDAHDQALLERIAAFIGPILNAYLERKREERERERAEETLRRSEAIFRNFVESAPFGILISHGPEQSVVSLNRKFVDLFGYGIEDVPDAARWWPLAYPDAAYRRRVQALWGKSLDEAKEVGSESGPIEVWITCKDGSHRYVRAFLSNLGEVKAVVFVDLTEWKQAEEALVENEAKYRTLVEHLPQHIFVKDRDSVFLSCNSGFAGVVGRTVDEVVGETDFDLFPNRQDAEKYRADDRRIMETGVGDVMEEPLQIRGEKRWARTTKVPLHNDVGDVVGVVGIFEDITEWKAAQERLRLSEERYRAVSDLSSDYSYAFRVEADRSLTLEWVTSAATGMTGIPVDELMKPNGWLRTFYPEDLPLFFEKVEELRSGDHAGFEGRLLNASGQPFWVRFYLKPELNDQGGVVRVYGAIQDIQRQKEAERLILASLKEKEVLLREVHHRVKNNLQVISSLLDLQLGGIQDDLVRQVFNESKSRIHSIALIHDQLYRTDDFARIDIAGYTENLCTSLLRSYGIADRVVGTVHMPGSSLPLDAAIPCGLIMNELITNCLKHAFPGERRGEVRISMESTAENTMALRVKDNGVGFPRGFDFGGAGSLGLTIVATLVRQLKGTMEVRSDGGAEILVVFPMPRRRAET